MVILILYDMAILILRNMSMANLPSTMEAEAAASYDDGGDDGGEIRRRRQRQVAGIMASYGDDVG